MRHFITYLSLFIFGFLHAQNSTFSASFRSLENGEPILYAKVVNSEGVAKLTNITGSVEIPCILGSKIQISHLNYDTLFIETKQFIGQDSLVFYLQPRVYTLKQFSFSILGERGYFDNKFVKNDLGKSAQEKVREQLNIKDLRSTLVSLDRAAQDGVVLGSPISYLYDRYSKAGKEKRKYAELIARDKQMKATRKKFDNLIVTSLTSYSDEDLVEFKAFCSFHPTYIEQVDALQLYYEILRCKKEYIEKEY